MRIRQMVEKVLTDSKWRRDRVQSRVLRPYFEAQYQERPSMFDLDWDFCIVLDGCRHDLFRDVFADRPGSRGEMGVRESVGSSTDEFLSRSVAGESHHDTVAVTANVRYGECIDDECFHAVDHVWRDDWDDDDETVPPGPVTERAIDAAERYPDKRILVHYIQPHAPFIGDVRLPSPSERIGKRRVVYQTPWQRLRLGDVSRDEVWRAYRSNLELVWSDVYRLLDEFDGRTVVTSDHGNALGERSLRAPMRIFGHPSGIHIPSTTRVPYLVHESGSRRDVVPKPPVGSGHRRRDAVVEEQLTALGYR